MLRQVALVVGLAAALLLLGARPPKAASPPASPAACTVAGTDRIRFAVLFFGASRLRRRDVQPRVANIVENLLSPIQAVPGTALDVFVHEILIPRMLPNTRSGETGVRTRPLGRHLPFVCAMDLEPQATVDEHQELARRAEFSLAAFSKEHPRNVLSSSNKWGYGKKTFQNLFRAVYSMGRAAQLALEHERTSGFQYTHALVAGPTWSTSPASSGRPTTWRSCASPTLPTLAG